MESIVIEGPSYLIEIGGKLVWKYRADEIVDEARTWIGARYHHQGRTKAGVDCIGLIGGVASALGLPEAAQWAADREAQGYGREPEPELLAKLCARYLDKIEVAGVGDILLLVVPPVIAPRHFAIVTGLDPLYVVHAYARSRKVVETSLPSYMTIAGAFRYREA